MNPDDAFINEALIERVDFIDNELLLNGEWEYQRNHGTNEKRLESELDRIADAMEKRDYIVICQKAVRKYPFMFMQVLAEYVIELLSNQRRVKGYGKHETKN